MYTIVAVNQFTPMTPSLPHFVNQIIPRLSTYMYMYIIYINNKQGFMDSWKAWERGQPIAIVLVQCIN